MKKIFLFLALIGFLSVNSYADIERTEVDGTYLGRTEEGGIICTPSGDVCYFIDVQVPSEPDEPDLPDNGVPVKHLFIPSISEGISYVEEGSKGVRPDDTYGWILEVKFILTSKSQHFYSKTEYDLFIDTLDL